MNERYRAIAHAKTASRRSSPLADRQAPFPALLVQRIEFVHIPSPTLSSNYPSWSLSTLLLPPPTAINELEQLMFAGQIRELLIMEFQSTAPEAHPPP